MVGFRSIPFCPIPKDLSTVIINELKPWPNMSVANKQYLQVLNTVKFSNKLELDESNYLRYLKIVLWLDEFKNELELKKYDMFDQEVIKDSIKIKGLIKDTLFKIRVESLMEESPSVTVNDFVDITDPKTNIKYCLKVAKVLDEYIIVSGGESFCQVYKPDNRYNIKFRFNNFPYRCSHYGLSLIYKFDLASYIFPKGIRSIICNSNSNFTWFNKSIDSNPQQKQCINNIINKTSLGAPYILYGPPGTGKTATVVEAVCQAWRLPTCKRILICTPSNSSADLLTKRLLMYLPKKELHRIYSYSTVVSTIDEEILDCSNCVNKKIIIFSAQKLPKIVITTLITSTRLLFLDLSPTAFSYVFIDEAGQAMEPETLIPFTLLSSARMHEKGRLHGQIVLAGDPQQLGPVVMSRLADIILGKSMLERLMSTKPYNEFNPRYVTKLLKNYRSHPSLIYVSNNLFYNGDLKVCSNERKGENWIQLPNPKFPIIFSGIRGTEISDKYSPSIYNLMEMEKVVLYVKLLMGSKLGDSVVRPEDIGIVTPYKAQRIKLQRQLKNKNLSDIEVGTVQLFQGKEKEIIILSTVRTNPLRHKDPYPLGFLSCPKRFNVALTRAKSLLIVIGHPEVLQIDKCWNYFINFCRQNNAYCHDASKSGTLIDKPTDEMTKIVIKNNNKLTSKKSSKLNISINDVKKENNIKYHYL